MNQPNDLDATMVNEAFVPELCEMYESRYQAMLNQISNSLPMNRVHIIKNEITSLNQYADDNEAVIANLDMLKYEAVLHVLVDLSQQGWAFSVRDSVLYLSIESGDIEDKEHVRYRLSAERNAQFKSKSVQSFIMSLETPREYREEVRMSSRCQ